MLNAIAYFIVFALLNRLRGMSSWFRPSVALGIAFASFFIVGNFIVFILTFALAWAGIVMGWGDWDCVATNRNAKKPNPYTEGDYNGIQWIAEKIISSDTHWLNHCRVCLVIMGAYRAFFLLPLSYWCGWNAIYAFLFLAPMFWIASELGYYTSKLWNFKYMTGGWEHQEWLYGAAVGIAIFILR